MSDDLQVETRLPDTLNEWEGAHARIFADTTRELDVEGARMSAKTTLLLDKEIHFLKNYSGIHTLICRFSDKATSTKLRPRFEMLCAIRGFTDYQWNPTELAYEFSNGSKCFAFGLRTASQAARYEKIRGTDLSRVYNDQTEETPGDIGLELRASLRQKGFPHQLTFSPNPPDPTHWIADERHGGFPEDNTISGRKYYRLSIYDNAYNLDPADIAAMEATYPPDHPKHGSMILGRRGFHVIGTPLFEDTFMRRDHLRPLQADPVSPLLEAFEFGKRNPCWIVGQRLYAGGLALLGGIIGEKLFLDDFLPIVREYRAKWFPAATFHTCCTAPGSDPVTTGWRFTGLRILQSAGWRPVYRQGSNAPDVKLALLEQLAGYMRRRNAMKEECFGINKDDTRWLKASRQGVEQWPFVAPAFEACAVWDDNLVSVGNQKVRQMKTDDWFSNAISCVQSIEVNFGIDQPTPQERERLRRANEQSVLRAKLPRDPQASSDTGWMH